ncbi:unnamed protein product, partial [Allacma fusca]
IMRIVCLNTSAYVLP